MTPLLRLPAAAARRSVRPPRRRTPSRPKTSTKSSCSTAAASAYCHTHVRKHDGEDKAFRVTSSLDLTLRRFSTQVRLRRSTGTFEDAEGKVLGVFMKQNPGDGQATGTLRHRRRRRQALRQDRGRGERRVAWNPNVLGGRGQETLVVARPAIDVLLARLLRNDQSLLRSPPSTSTPGDATFAAPFRSSKSLSSRPRPESSSCLSVPNSVHEHAQHLAPGVLERARVHAQANLVEKRRNVRSTTT